MELMQHTICAARIKDGDQGYEHNAWTVPSQTSDEPRFKLLRADSVYYKNIDEKHDVSDCSDMGLFKTLHMIHPIHMQHLMHAPHTHTDMVFSGILLNMRTHLKEGWFNRH